MELQWRIQDFQDEVGVDNPWREGRGIKLLFRHSIFPEKMKKIGFKRMHPLHTLNPQIHCFWIFFLALQFTKFIASNEGGKKLCQFKSKYSRWAVTDSLSYLISVITRLNLYLIPLPLVFMKRLLAKSLLLSLRTGILPLFDIAESVRVALRWGTPSQPGRGTSPR